MSDGACTVLPSPRTVTMATGTGRPAESWTIPVKRVAACAAGTGGRRAAAVTTARNLIDVSRAYPFELSRR